MAADPRQSRFVAEVVVLLEALRGRVRRYVWAEGLALVAVCAALLFWMSLAADWFFEPALAWRILGSILAVALVAYAAYWFLVRRMAVALTDRSLAVVVERRFPQLNDRLLTVVEAADNKADSTDPLHNEMLAATTSELLAILPSVDLDRIFNPWPLTRGVLAAVALLSTGVVLWGAQSAVVETWARRNLLFSGELYPRETHLFVDGFEHGFIKVARGADAEIIARADTRGSVPPTVQVQYRTDEGARGRANMSREGNAVAPRDPFQRYAHTFQGVLSPIRFDLAGGDDRLRDLRIEVVENPTVNVAESMLICEFPAYTGRAPRELPITGVVQLPRGTRVRLRATANKDLVDVDLAEARGEDARPAQTLLPAADVRRRFEVDLAELDGDRTLLFTLHDTDGITSREPWRLLLAAVPDEPPQVQVRLRGIGPAITPQARLPVLGEVKDDYGLARLWFALGIADAPTTEREFAATVSGRTEVAIDEALDVRELKLEPGQKLRLEIKARDGSALREGANTGVGEAVTLDVVTPDALRTMLESRELNLRRRFEQIISEVTELRDELSRFAAPPRRAARTTGNRAQATFVAFADEPPAQPKVTQPEVAAPAKEADAARRDDPAALQLAVERDLQGSRKNADETLSLAEAFNEVHDELVNNRVDTEDLKQRIKQGIAEPLRSIATVQFPELERRLEHLATVASNAEALPEARLGCQQQLDAILVEMQQVLGLMMKAETMTEAVDLLRSILNDTQKLNDGTKQQQKRKAQKLKG